MVALYIVVWIWGLNSESTQVFYVVYCGVAELSKYLKILDATAGIVLDNVIPGCTSAPGIDCNQQGWSCGLIRNIRDLRLVSQTLP